MIAITTAAIFLVVALLTRESSESRHKPIPRSLDSLPILYDTLAIVNYRNDMPDWVTGLNY